MAGTPTRLADWLAEQQSKYLDVSDGWRRFISDHREEIRQAAFASNPPLVYRPSLDVMNLVEYDLKRFLRDYTSVPDSLDWICFLINPDFSCNLEFTGQPLVYVPPPAYIEKLYVRYLASSKTRVEGS